MHAFIYNLDEEDDLEETCMRFSRGGFPLDGDKLKILAYELAQANGRSGFSIANPSAGRKWLSGFLERKPDLKKKMAKNCSIFRVSCANPTQVAKFFNEYEAWLEQWNLEYNPCSIWNVDESGLPDIPKKRLVIGVKGEPASQTVSGEQPENTTIVTFVSAGGLAMPPMVIFKASKILPEYREAAPSGYVLRRNPTGYISAELFADYGKLFVKFLKEKNIIGPNKKALLLLDSHKSHMYNLDFMECMKKNNIEVCCFPPPHNPHAPTFGWLAFCYTQVQMAAEVAWFQL